MKDSLFICFTVYQLKLAKLIIENNVIDDYLVIYFGESNSKVNSFLTKNKLTKIHFFEYEGSKIIKYLYLYYFIKKLNLNRVENIFVATLNAKEIKIILSCIVFDNIIGFDDGLGSILPHRKNGLYVESSGFLLKAFFKILGLNKYKNLHTKINKFYGVYPEKFYGFNEFERIKIINKDTISVDFPKKEIKKIFIGQPYVNIGIDRDKILRFIVKNNIDYYLPHPAESEKMNFKNVVVTDVLSEDFIVDMVRDGYDVYIYSLFSTVIFNLCCVDNISCFGLYNDELILKYPDVYKLMDDFSIDKLKIE